MKNLKLTIRAWPAIFLVTVALCFLTGLLAKAVGHPLPEQAQLEAVRRSVLWLVRHMCGNAGWNWIFFRDLWALVRIAAVIVVFAPLLEETVFRWLLWRLPRPAHPAVPAVTSSLLFSAAHYIQAPWPDDAFAALFFFGLAQCWLYWKTARLWCPMLNHALFNATNLALLFVLPE